MWPSDTPFSILAGCVDAYLPSYRSAYESVTGLVVISSSSVSTKCASSTAEETGAYDRKSNANRKAETGGRRRADTRAAHQRLRILRTMRPAPTTKPPTMMTIIPAISAMLGDRPNKIGITNATAKISITVNTSTRAVGCTVLPLVMFILTCPSRKSLARVRLLLRRATLLTKGAFGWAVLILGSLSCGCPSSLGNKPAYRATNSAEEESSDCAVARRSLSFRGRSSADSCSGVSTSSAQG